MAFDGQSGFADQSAQRSRSLRAGIAGSLGVRAVGIIAPLLLVPTTLHYLGPALFGLWASLTAVAAVTTFSDLGMGNGLLTLIPRALANGDERHARALVSSAYALLTAVSVGLLTILGATFPFVRWEAFFDPDRTHDPVSVRIVVAVALGFTAVGAPLGLSLRLYYATQRADLAAIWTSTSVLAPLVPVLVGVWLGWSPFLVVVVLVASGPAVQLLATVWLFVRVTPRLRPSARLASIGTIRQIAGLGGLFLLLSVALVFSNSLDNLILTHSVGLTAVAAFAIPAKVFAQIQQVFTLINLPLWAAHGDALARGDKAWVARTTSRMVLASAGAAIVATLITVLCGPMLLELWLRQPLALPHGLILGLGCATIVTAALGPLFMLQNAAGSVLPQIVGWGAFALVTVPAKYLTSSHYGIEAVPWVSFIGLFILVAPVCFYGARRVIHNLTSRQTE